MTDEFAPQGLTFPAGFRWGVATAAYQIEGAVDEDGRTPSIWDTFCHQPGRIANGDTADVACDHYHRWVEDLDLMARLGVNSYRFSVSWPRVIPEGTGPVNAKGLDFYRRLTDGLLERGIQPMVTIFHWDLPQVLQDRGGWVNRDAANWFADYAQVLYQALSDANPLWVTLNEPKTVAELGYRDGSHAPGIDDADQMFVALHHMLLGHGLAVRALRDGGHRGPIGIALNLSPIYPDPPGDEQAQAAARLVDGFSNRLYLDPVLRGRYPDDMIAAFEPPDSLIRAGDLDVIGTPLDLLGVQYYTPAFISPGGYPVTKYPLSAASWQQVYPEGLYDLLVRLRDDYGQIPIYVTENGRPGEDVIGPGGQVDDPERIAFLRDSLVAAHRAVRAGVPLAGYYVWSLLDNFEWAEGLGQRWGLVYVDHATQRRTPKSSFDWYRAVVARNGL